jgi:hypothetical protein
MFSIALRCNGVKIPRTLSGAISISRRFILVAVLISLSLAAPALDAQTFEAPKPYSEANLLISNAVIGAATAAVTRAIGRKPIAAGAIRGAIAGAGVYAGKRLIGNGQPGYWWLGRELSALASSEIGNAGRGLKPLEHAIVPIGPVRIHVNRLARQKIVPRLDVVSTVGAIVIGSRNGVRIAWNETFSTGAIVFLTPETSDQIGNYAAGVLSVSELAPDGNFPPLESKRSVMSHEMTHATQYDFSFNAWSEPLRGAMETRLPWISRRLRYLDVNLTLPVNFVLNSFTSYQDRPWEREAVTVSGHAP